MIVAEINYSEVYNYYNIINVCDESHMTYVNVFDYYSCRSSQILSQFVQTFSYFSELPETNHITNGKIIIYE